MRLRRQGKKGAPGSQQAVLPESHAGHQGLTNWTPPPSILCGSLRTIRPPTPTALAFYLPEPTPTSQFLPPVQLILPPRTPSSLFPTLPFSSSPTRKHPPSPHTSPLALNMASRPQNIGIKAIEVYFPSQVRAHHAPASPMSHLAPCPVSRPKLPIVHLVLDLESC